MTKIAKGFRLVPVEQTYNMRVQSRTRHFQDFVSAEQWKAMLAAAPVSPLEEAVARLIEAARELRTYCYYKPIVEALRALDTITQEKPDAPKNG